MVSSWHKGETNSATRIRRSAVRFVGPLDDRRLGLERSVLQPVGGFALGITRANSRRVAARRAEKRRLTGRSGKGGSNFSKEAIIDSCGPRDRWRCKKRIETSATFQGYERHAGNPIGTSTFSLLLYLPPFRDRLCCPFCPFRLTFRPHKDHPEHHSRCLAQYSIPEVYRIKPKETDSGSIADAKLFPKPFTFSSYHFSFHRLPFLRRRVVPIPTRIPRKILRRVLIFPRSILENTKIILAQGEKQEAIRYLPSKFVIAVLRRFYAEKNILSSFFLKGFASKSFLKPRTNREESKNS